MENPSQHQLDKLLEGPRVWSRYFDEQIAKRFPTGGRDPESEAREAASLRSLMGQLHSYQKQWSHKYIAKTIRQFHELAPTNEVEQASYNELTFHVISQYITEHWQRVFNPFGAPRLDSRSLAAAQVKLALESMDLQTYRQDQADIFEDGAYVTNQINDIDTMIALIQVMVDADTENLHGIVATPAPLLPDTVADGTHFLAFTPDYRSEPQATSIASEALHAAIPTPASGALAQAALRRVRINELSRWPEFPSINAFMSAKLRLPKNADDQGAVEEARRQVAEVLRNHLT